MPSQLKVVSFLFLILAACSAGTLDPVPIESGDMCSFCKMAISEKQFAAEIILDDETVLKFDDIGCLLRYRQASGDKLKVAAVFVTDHSSRQWVKAGDAYFVRSKTVKTPMGSGILAFGSESDAGQEGLRFEDLRP